MPYWSKLPCNYHSLTPLCDGPTFALKSGDIGFYVEHSDDGSFKFEHTVIIGRSNNWLVHSNKVRGVYTSNLNKFRKAVFFRFNGMSGVAEGASALAHHWSRGHYHSGDSAFEETTHQVVGFSSAHWKGFRAANAALGMSAFGPGARARLAKYRKRENIAPKNTICSEMVILAYQLIVGIEEECYGFINLDAKHTLPATLALYLNNNPYWSLIGRGGR